MKISSTSARLKEIMNEKGLKQVDILIAQSDIERYKNELWKFYNE